IDWQVTDLLEHTRCLLEQYHIASVADVRRTAESLVAPGPEVRKLKTALEEFLHDRVYSHHRIARMAGKGRRLVQALFTEYCRHPEFLRDRYAVRAREQGVERTVCDYLAGMTDRYAQDEYLRLFQPYTDV